MMFNRKKPSPIQPPPKKKLIELTADQFLTYVINYESGKISPEDILIFFAYIVENEKYVRYGYPWLLELMEFGVIQETGMINPQKLQQYKNSKL